VANDIASIQAVPSLGNLALFSEMTPRERDTVLSTAERKSICDPVFCEGDPIRRVTMLLSGCVKITKVSFRGDEVILRLCGVGEFIGTFYLTDRGVHCSTAYPIQPCVVLAWHVEMFHELLERFPVFRRNVLRALEERLHDLEHRFSEISTQNVAARLSSELIRLCEHFAKSVNGRKEIHLSQKELAQLTATTLYTVNRLLCRWERLGIVSVRKRVVQVRDLAALAEFAGRE
jgi:CRP-like cAMP-binding protein